MMQQLSEFLIDYINTLFSDTILFGLSLSFILMTLFIVYSIKTLESLSVRKVLGFSILSLAIGIIVAHGMEFAMLWTANGIFGLEGPELTLFQTKISSLFDSHLLSILMFPMIGTLLGFGWGYGIIHDTEDTYSILGVVLSTLGVLAIICGLGLVAISSLGLL